MTRYSGVIGYAEQADWNNGVWENDRVVERHYYGDVQKLSRNLQNGSSVLPDITVSNTISVIADAYAYNNFANIKYVMWAGTRWSVSSIEVNRPRINLTLGGVYNGPTP